MRHPLSGINRLQKLMYECQKMRLSEFTGLGLGIVPSMGSSDPLNPTVEEYVQCVYGYKWGLFWSDVHSGCLKLFPANLEDKVNG